MATCVAASFLVISCDPPAKRAHQASRAVGSRTATTTPASQPTAATPGVSGPPSWISRLPTFPAAPVPAPVRRVETGTAPVYSRVPTDQRVAFLTIDDGYVRFPQAAAALHAVTVPVSAFLLSNLVDSPAAKMYFGGVAGNTSSIEAHTISHPKLPGTSYAFQYSQICGSADALAGAFGRRPTLFRPPYGYYDATTLRVAHDCGFQAVVTWTVVVEYGKVAYQTSVRRVQPGDILLLHFRSSFAEDLSLALGAIRDAGLTPALLEDYLTDRRSSEPPPALGQPQPGF